ncbi:MAG: hypothetical protein P8X64_16240 [Anaerolineales bacterium]
MENSEKPWESECLKNEESVALAGSNVGASSLLVETFLGSIKDEKLVTCSCSTEGSAQMLIHTPLVSKLESKNQGEESGFHFNQLHLIFYKRFMILYALLG